MKVIFKTIALFISMNFTAMIPAEASVWINGIEYSLGAETADVIGYDKTLEAIDIPETIHVDGNDHTVVSIAPRAFFNSTITSINLPDKLTAIGEKAFYGSKGLTDMVIPNSVVSIGEYAFEKCLSIENVSISTSLRIIQEGTFFDCYALKSVAVPSSVGYIAKSAFSGCHAMESVSLPATVDSIGRYAFYACDALKTMALPSNVKKLGGNSFWNCAALESISISPAVKEIESGTFYGCKALSSVILSESLEKIGERAFEQCLKLPLVVLPPSITTIGDDAFKNCEMLTTIVSYPTVAPTVGSNAFYRVPDDAVVYVPAGTLEQYPSAEGWSGLKDFRELGSVELTISTTQLDLRVDETATLSVEVEKAYDVVIESESWWTSNPEVAIVEDGKVTAIGEGNATILYTVIDGTGCPHRVSCDVFVYGVAGVEGITDGGFNEEVIEYYNLNGVRVNPESLAPGLYIKREGKRSKKILVR